MMTHDPQTDLALDTRRPVIFDLDETLYNGTPTNFDDPAHVAAVTSPNERAIAFAHALIDSGARVMIVTARSRVLEDLTYAQLADVGLLDGVEVWMQARFTTLADAAAWKANVAELLRAVAVIGDSWIDEHAADKSGALFLLADNLRVPAHAPAMPAEAARELVAVANVGVRA